MGQLNEISQLKSAFLPGSQLWAVPLSPNSAWFKKLNWYTSSQMTLWVYKKQASFSESLTQIIKKEQLPFAAPKNTENKTLLVHSQDVFPNKGVIAIDVNMGLENWLVELHQKASALKLNSIRIFWGNNQIEDFLKGLMNEQQRFVGYDLEVVTCEPEPL